MQPDHFDHRPNLRLGRPQAQGAPFDAKPPRERGEIEHQRRIRERKLTHVHDHIALRLDRARERLAAIPLGRLVLVPSTAQYRGDVIEVDDPGNLHGRGDGRKGQMGEFCTELPKLGSRWQP